MGFYYKTLALSLLFLVSCSAPYPIRVFEDASVGTPSDGGNDTSINDPYEPLPFDPTEVQPLPEGWTQTLGDPGWVGVHELAVGPSGEIAIVGRYTSRVDLAPGDSVEERGNEEDFLFRCFITILEPNGELRWVATPGGGYCEFKSAAFAPDGSVVARGAFENHLEFEDGSELTGANGGGFRTFIASFTPSGELMWAQNNDLAEPDSELDGRQAHNRVAVDREGNIFFLGSFSGQADLDPGPETDIRTSDRETNALVALTADGRYRWAATLDDDGLEGALSVAAAPDGTLRLLVPTTVENYRRSSIVQSMSRVGAVQWSVDLPQVAHAITAGSEGETHIIGAFQGEIDLDPGSGQDIRHAGGHWWSTYLITLDRHGNYLWGGVFGGDEHGAQAQDISMTLDGSMIVVGYFYDQVDFDPGPGEASAVAINERDAFVVRLTGESGQFEWLRTFGVPGSGGTAAFTIGASPSGCVVFAGSFGEVVDFDPGSGIDEHRPDTFGPVFVTRLLPEGTYER